jgi:signal transduction histidine kinase
LFANYRTEHRFSEADRKALDLGAGQAAATIRNAQLKGFNPNRELLNWACSATRKALRVDFCTIALAKGENKLSIAAVDGWPANFVGLDLSRESLAAATFRMRTPIRVANFSTDEQLKPPPFASDFHIISAMGVPMFRGEDVIGAVLVHSSRPREFTDDETGYLETLARQTAIGIKEYGERAGKRTSDRLRALADVSGSLSDSTAADVKSLYSDLLLQATNYVTDALGKKAVLGTVQEFDESARSLTFVAVHPPDMYPDLVKRIGEKRDLGDDQGSGLRIGLTGRCALAMATQFEANVEANPDYLEFHNGTVAEIVVPLIMKGKVRAVLNLESERGGAFDQDDVTTLETIAKVAVLAIERLESRTQAEGFRERFKYSLLAACHELKGPLTTIKQMTQLLIMNEFGELPVNAIHRLHLIRDESAAELRTATNLLNMFEIHEGKWELAPENSDLSALARSLVERFRERATRQKAFLDGTQIMDGIVLRMDKSIENVIINLLDNALKFTSSRDGGVVKLLVTGTPEKAICSVEDDGPGIRPDQMDRVFDRFYSVGIPDKNQARGLGIGLSVSKYFVEQQGGRLWVDNPAKPTRLSFELPRRS